MISSIRWIESICGQQKILCTIIYFSSDIPIYFTLLNLKIPSGFWTQLYITTVSIRFLKSLTTVTSSFLDISKVYILSKFWHINYLISYKWHIELTSCPPPSLKICFLSFSSINVTNYQRSKFKHLLWFISISVWWNYQTIIERPFSFFWWMVP